ncbi:xanthine dehydrogenase family protein [Ancylobacter sonchi]|nr:xanthine dehydrogenase family protein [Ancylobacter sonchi]
MKSPKTEAAIGLTMSRLEALEKASGAAAFTEDMTLPGMLHGALVLSPHAHARILGYDLSRALALPGVKAVITGAEIGRRYMGLVVKDETALAVDKVRYIGEPVAAVAAIDVATARAAAALVEVEYEPLPAVFTIEEAIAEGAPILHEDFASYFKIYDASTCRLPNELTRSEIILGDVAKGFAECDVVVERVYETAAQNHIYMEPCAALAAVDGRGKVTVWSSTQSVFRTQANVHESLGIPMARIRSVVPRVGGGFGGKSEATVQPVAAALALKTGRPVRVVLSREEDMITMRARHPARMRVKTGARRDGTLVAREFEAWFDGGAYADDSPAVLNFAMFFAGGPYRFEHVRVEGHAIYTNKLRAGAFRGFGNPQATFASESQIDEIARELGMDPLELRLKNIVKPGDRWLGGQTLATSGLEACIDKVIDASRWRERHGSPLPAPAGKRRGLGLTLTAHVCGFLSTSAIVRLAEDGSVTLNTGAVDLGQGSDTVLSQMCAAGLGLGVDDVNFVAPDTDASPYNSGTNCSRVTYMVGRAVGEATQAVQAKMAKIAARILECPEDDVELLPGGLMGVAGSNRTVSFKEIAARSLWFADGGGPVIGSGSIMHNEPLDPKHTLLSGMVSFHNVGAFIFGAQVAEVEIDEVTGKVDIVEAWCAHDVGRAVNPGAVEGQIQGGFVQGAGYALSEEMLWKGGRLINPSLSDYKIPCALDVPYEIRSFVVEVPDPTHPFGAKGVGEPPLIGAGPVIANAIADAGFRVRRLPITPERMLRAMLNGEDGVDV